MAFLNNIRTVARYEAKTLRRSWFFRLFSIGAVFIFTFMNIGFFSPVGDEPWEMISIPSSIPLFNLYLLNVGQAIVVIFLAADFLKRDKKVDTNEVLYTRSMSNLEYIIGKSWGIFRLFMGLDIIILSIGLLMNIISKGTSIDLMSYISYLLIISVPTIFFSLGLAFILMSVIRNQAITFLILLGIAILNMFWLWYRIGSIFDYMAFGLPVFKSSVIGFDNMSQILYQRFLYFFLGISFVLGTVLLFRRLPQSKLHTSLAAIIMLFSFAISGICAYNTYYLYKKNNDEKKLVIETNKRFETMNVVSLTDASIEFIHKGNYFEASAKLKFINDNKESLDKYLFSLNPYLNVSRITSGGKDLNFIKTNQIIEIEPTNILSPGQIDSADIYYSGSIDESFCYPDYSDNLKENPYRVAILNVNKRQAFLSKDYVLLVPETYWYPVPGLNYYPSNPARIKVDFTNFNLKVKAEEGLAAVSQGKFKSENGYSVFTNESPLTGLTLAIGKYRSDTLNVDSVKYISFYFQDHDFYKKDLLEIKDTLPLLISGIMRELETTFSTKYPFKTLSLLEVPVQFYSYPRMNTQTRAELQPSMVLLPEKLSTLLSRSFGKQFSRQKKRAARNNEVVTDKELKVRIFNNFLRNTFISGENFRVINGVPINEPVRYRLGPSFYFFKNNFYSSEYPVINTVFESHLQKVISPQGGFRSMLGGLSENDKANLILKYASLREILSKNPGPDTIRAIVTIKGDYFFNLLRSKAGITEFSEWFQKYINDNKFKRVDILKFNDDINKRFGFEFYPYLNDWFNRKEQPGFLFTDLQVNEIIVGDRLRYLVTFTASNPEPVAGLFNVSVRSGGQRAGQQMTGIFRSGAGNITVSMQGRGMEAADISRIVFIGPEEAKKIKIILDAQPRTVMINPLVAKNIPGEIILPVTEIIKSRSKQSEMEGEEVLESLPKYFNPDELIVDNEDPGFNTGKVQVQSPLKRLLRIKNNTTREYEQISMFNFPESWQPVVQSVYYGKYVLSSVYTRSGNGDKAVTWSTKIDEPGYYDIYCYVGKTGEIMTIRNITGTQGPPPPPGDNPSRDNVYKDMHYKIYHDEGMDEITVDFNNAEAGWNNLGRYYLSTDSAKVELTNQSTGKVVLADAIKWVKVK